MEISRLDGFEQFIQKSFEGMGESGVWFRSVQSGPVQDLYVFCIDFKISRQKFFDFLDFQGPVGDTVKFHDPAELTAAMV